MPKVRVEGSLVDYDIMGEGDRPVIFVHGGFGSSSRLWRETMVRLPPGYIAFAINNFIRSEAPPAGYSVSSFARRVANFIDVLAIQRPVLVGHSMGGVVCQMVALNYPTRIAGLVLVGSGASMRNHGVGHDLLVQMRSGELSRESMRSISANWFENTPADFFDQYVELAVQAPPQAMIDVQESLIATDLVDQLGGIRVPTLIIHGALDKGRKLEHAETLRDGIPDSRLVVIPESGHTPMIETPKEFDLALHLFLDALPWSATTGSDHVSQAAAKER